MKKKMFQQVFWSLVNRIRTYLKKKHTAELAALVFCFKFKVYMYTSYMRRPCAHASVDMDNFGYVPVPHFLDK